MTRPIRIVMVDDHYFILESMRAQLETDPDLHVLAIASDADHAIELAAAHVPDIVLMDIDMPGRNCFSAAGQITSTHAQIKIIFLSAFTHDRYIEQALRVKALGYVAKSEPSKTVIAAIKQVADGVAWFSDSVRERIVVDHHGIACLAQEEHTRAEQLTPREAEILQYIARGMARKAIAHTIHISTNTVETHVQNIMSKLNMHDRVELTRFAIREGIENP